MLSVVLGITLTAVLVLNLWERRGWNPADLGMMSQPWMAAHLASQRASPN